VGGACASTPKTLHLCGRVAAGEIFGGEVAAGDCVRIFTGSPLPRGTDAVIMQEDTRPTPNQPDAIQFLDTAKPWENVRFRGEDVKRGAILGEIGDVLTPNRLALLAAAGVA